MSPAEFEVAYALQHIHSGKNLVLNSKILIRLGLFADTFISDMLYHILIAGKKFVFQTAISHLIDNFINVHYNSLHHINAGEIVYVNYAMIL